MPALRHLAALLMLAALVAACASDDGPAETATTSAPSPSPTPPPSPSPTIAEVRGDAAAETTDVDHRDTGLFQPGSGAATAPARDTAAVEDFVDTVTGTLDEHLTAALREGTIDVSSQPAYDVDVAAMGGPQWALAHVDADGDAAAPVGPLLFAPGPDGTARLLAAEGAPATATPPRPGEVRTLLLLGADRGPPRGGSPLSANADGFHLLFVSADGAHATIVNIPRDSWGTVAGRGRAKINACLSGGPENCVATVEARWGLEVDGWLLTSMRALMHAVDAVGGVRIDVPRPLTDGGQDITQTGPQRLNGAQALTYARDRKHRPDGDLDRTEAQGVLLAALHEQLRDDADLQRLAELLRIVASHTVTDLPPGMLAELGATALRLQPANVEVVTPPASVGTAGSASVVYLGDAADAIIADAADDGRLSP